MRTWTDEEFIKAFNEASSIKDALHRLNLSPSGAYNNFKKHAARLGLDINILNARKIEQQKKLISNCRKAPLANDIIFVENSMCASKIVRRRILNENLLEYKCNGCGIDEWCSKFSNNILVKITLDLDHINGINNDHRLENLRFLCPNCHSQTPTYKAKNKNKK